MSTYFCVWNGSNPSQAVPIHQDERYSGQDFWRSVTITTRPELLSRLRFRSPDLD